MKRVYRSGLAQRLPVFRDYESGVTLHSLLGDGFVDGTTVLMLVGPRPTHPDFPAGSFGGWQAWLHNVPADWQVDKRGHYLGDPENPVLRFCRGNARVEIRRWNSWVRESNQTNRHDARSAWLVAADALGRRWYEPADEAVILPSPAATGRHLWLRSIPHGVDVPAMDPETADRIRAMSTQGRIEIFDRAPGATIQTVQVWDARLAYLSLCTNLGSGEPVKGRFEDGIGDPYGHGKSLVTWSAPIDWPFPGLLPLRTSDGWKWPLTGTGWVDNSELHLAASWGWHVSLARCATGYSTLRWDNTRSLDLWCKNLLRAIDDINSREFVRDAVRRQAAACVRAVGLFGIGAFQGRAFQTTHQAPFATANPSPTATGLDLSDDDILTWQDSAAGRSQTWAAHMAHPEWTSTIWARARCRLASAPTAVPGKRAGFLHLPPRSVIAVRTDSLFIADHKPEWADDGRPGRYRLKAAYTFPEPVPTPTSWTQLDRMLATPF